MMRLFLLLAFLPFSLLQAELKLGSPFTNQMVLQRDSSIPVWGKAKPGEQVNVAFQGQSQSTKADQAGKWMLHLDALKGTSEGSNFSVKSGTSQIELKDVVVGEVWICSGQSNMAFDRKGVKELKGLSEKGIRTFEVKKTVAFTEQDELEGSWKVVAPGSAVAFGFAHHFAKEIDGEFPVGIILTAWGSSAIEAWMPRDMGEELPYFKKIMAEWDANKESQRQVQASLDKGKWTSKEDVFMRRQINIIYNAMMKPLAPFACRGLVWYQGERNERYLSGMPAEPWFHRVGSIENYDEILKAWVTRYRKEWANDEMKFYIVMLPGYGNLLPTSPTKEVANPTSHSRAWMRESQLKVLDLPNTAVVNTVDLGDAKNNHPRDKEPIGKRLALFAAKETLGKSIETKGPVFNRVEAKGKQLVVHFNHAKGLATKDGKAPREFWIADDQGNWNPATAKVAGTTVVLQSDKCPNPKHVRYAFIGMPDVNLINGDGLPAYPFRSDSFKP